MRDNFGETFICRLVMRSQRWVIFVRPEAEKGPHPDACLPSSLYTHLIYIWHERLCHR